MYCNYFYSFFSACTSASLEPSYVLRAIGADEDLAHSSIRFRRRGGEEREDDEQFCVVFILFCLLLSLGLVLDVSLLMKKSISQLISVSPKSVNYDR